jgi:hypothetical protein
VSFEQTKLGDYLIKQQPLVVQPNLAARIGLHEAIFIQQLQYWLEETTAGKEVDGRRWIYNTYEAWQEQFPFWSISTIRRIVKKLETLQLIESTSEFNQWKVDNTKWYTINYDTELEDVSTLT